MDIAVQEMTKLEHEAGKNPLLQIDWTSEHDRAPISTKPLRIARQRTEALDRL